MLSSMYISSIRSSNRLADQGSAFVDLTAARKARGRTSRRHRLIAAVDAGTRRAPTLFAAGCEEETRAVLRVRRAGMVTLWKSGWQEHSLHGQCHLRIHADGPFCSAFLMNLRRVATRSGYPIPRT